MASFTIGSGLFWLMMFVTCVAVVAPGFVLEYIRVRRKPQPNDIAAELQKFGLSLPAQPAPRKFEDPANHSRFVNILDSLPLYML
jgi:hypothetical protein